MSEPVKMRPAPKRFRPARRRDALCDHRRVAGHLVRAAAAACADGVASRSRDANGIIRSAPTSTISRAPKTAFRSPNCADLRERAAAPWRAVIETRKDQIAAQGFAIRSRNREDLSAGSPGDRPGHALLRPPRPAPFVRRLAAHAARGDVGHRRGDPLSARPSAAAHSMRSTSSTGSTIKPLIGEAEPSILPWRCRGTRRRRTWQPGRWRGT